ncbi:MAG: TIGR00730 family Rossman fold protein [Alphaproteobacteria bacterium]|nr:TIGR00730 family Rossman fold protein [Alphaproteobacteria bacterium]
MNNTQTLTVYLGSSGRARPVFKDAAAALGRLIAQNGKHLVYGGMDAGLMGILARTVLEHGGDVTGIIPRKIKDSERILGDLTETILVEELCERKKRMFLTADAVIALPGGFGTLDESLEILYWGALKLHAKPLILVDLEGYWSTLLPFIRAQSDFDPDFLITVGRLEDIFPALERWCPPTGINTDHNHYPHFEDEIMRGTDEPIIIDKPSIENAYFAVCALGLKQLGKHARPIGFLNTNGQFDGLLDWIRRAAEETFITEKCLKLYDAAKDKDTLKTLLSRQKPVYIDLHTEKWGA